MVDVVFRLTGRCTAEAHGGDWDEYWVGSPGIAVQSPRTTRSCGNIIIINYIIKRRGSKNKAVPQLYVVRFDLI